jgi:hypothetical protein
MAWPDARSGFPTPPRSHLHLQYNSLILRRKKRPGSGLDWGGFPDFAAHARNLPRHAHQHRLCARKEPNISMGCEQRRISVVPFACRFQPQNRFNPLPTFVSAHRIAAGHFSDESIIGVPSLSAQHVELEGVPDAACRSRPAAVFYTASRLVADQRTRLPLPKGVAPPRHYHADCRWR